MLHFIKFSFPHIANVSCAFQTRGKVIVNDPYSSGNISLEAQDSEETYANRKAITQSLHVDSFSEVKQVHGIKTLYEPDDMDFSKKPQFEADGLATTRKNHALCIKTADCQPILIADKKGEHILAIHAGWRGNRQEYPSLAVKEFCAHYKLKAQDLCAVRGPSLSPLVSEFIHYNTEWGKEFDAWFNAHNKCVNLWQLTKDQLKKAGMLEENIYSIDLCTYSNPDLFYSYRRIPKSGRQGSFIWIDPK